MAVYRLFKPAPDGEVTCPSLFCDMLSPIWDFLLGVWIYEYKGMAGIVPKTLKTISNVNFRANRTTHLELLRHAN